MSGPEWLPRREAGRGERGTAIGYRDAVTSPARVGGTAFVLGGGGKWGAVQVGMLRALTERGIRPDVVLGCSIGAINGAAFSADPSPTGVDRLEDFWRTRAATVFAGDTLPQRAKAMLGRKPSLYDNDGLRHAIGDVLPVRRFADLPVHFECVAACIDDASEHWFTGGTLVDALLASSAIPGLLPPVTVGDRHYYDGGLVNSIPLDRAALLGCTDVYVLQVGRIEQDLGVPDRLYQAPLVAFEIARRHRFTTFRRDWLGHDRGEGTTVHVLPSGHRLAMDDRRQLQWRRTDGTEALIRGAYEASAAYLDGIGTAGGPD